MGIVELGGWKRHFKVILHFALISVLYLLPWSQRSNCVQVERSGTHGIASNSGKGWGDENHPQFPLSVSRMKKFEAYNKKKWKSKELS